MITSELIRCCIVCKVAITGFENPLEIRHRIHPVQHFDLRLTFYRIAYTDNRVFDTYSVIVLKIKIYQFNREKIAAK